GDDETRLLMLLQAAAFMTLFRSTMGLGAPKEGDRLDHLPPAPGTASGPAALEAIFAEVSRDRAAAARDTLAYLQANGSPEELMTAARRLIFLKGSDSHDYKFSSAALEDYYHVSPAWRNFYLASSMFNLRGSGDRDNALAARARAALHSS